MHATTNITNKASPMNMSSIEIILINEAFESRHEEAVMHGVKRAATQQNGPTVARTSNNNN